MCLVKKRYFIAAHRQGIKMHIHLSFIRVHISVDLDAADAAATALLPSCCIQPIITFSVSLFFSFFLSKNVEIVKKKERENHLCCCFRSLHRYVTTSLTSIATRNNQQLLLLLYHHRPLLSLQHCGVISWSLSSYKQPNNSHTNYINVNKSQ